MSLFKKLGKAVSNVAKTVAKASKDSSRALGNVKVGGVSLNALSPGQLAAHGYWNPASFKQELGAGIVNTGKILTQGPGAVTKIALSDIQVGARRYNASGLQGIGGGDVSLLGFGKSLVSGATKLLGGASGAVQRVSAAVSNPHARGTNAWADFERSARGVNASVDELLKLPPITSLTSGRTSSGTIGGTISRLGLAGRGGLGGVVGGAAGLAGGLVGDLLGGGITKRLTPNGNGGCGCGSSGRDPCTRQKLGNRGAPLATFFGGCCPPGRVLRRTSWGRDICAKQPRMNPFNPRALARADRRITTFAKRVKPILRDMGYAVTSSRKVNLGKKRRRARR